MDILSVVVLSFQISFVSILLQSLPAIYFGYYLATSKTQLASILNVIFLLPLVLTPLVIGYFVLYLFQPDFFLGHWLQKIGIEIIFNWKGAVIAVSLVSFPLYVQAVQIAFVNTSEKLRLLSLFLGNKPYQTFFKVTLPLCKFGILRGALLAFTRNIGEFGATVVVAGIIPQKTETISSGIFRSLSIPSQENRVQLLVFTSLLISFIFLIFIQWLQTFSKNSL